MKKTRCAPSRPLYPTEISSDQEARQRAMMKTRCALLQPMHLTEMSSDEEGMAASHEEGTLPTIRTYVSNPIFI